MPKRSTAPIKRSGLTVEQLQAKKSFLPEMAVEYLSIVEGIHYTVSGLRTARLRGELTPEDKSSRTTLYTQQELHAFAEAYRKKQEKKKKKQEGNGTVPAESGSSSLMLLREGPSDDGEEPKQHLRGCPSGSDYYGLLPSYEARREAVTA